MPKSKSKSNNTPKKANKKATKKTTQSNSSSSYFKVSKPFITPGCTIRVGPRCELIGSISSGTLAAPAWKAIPLSLGVGSSFPWLSGIARSFEYFEMHNLRVRFQTNVASTFAGTVMIGCDYDAGDMPPASQIELGSWEGTCAGRIYDDVVFTANPKHLKLYKNRMVEANTASVANDPRLNSCGTVYVYATSNSSAADVGFIYLEYEVTLSSPQMATNASGLVNLTEPSAVTSSRKIAPIVQDVVTVANTVKQVLDIANVAGTDYLHIEAKKPVKGVMNLTVPPVSGGAVAIPVAGSCTKNLGSGSKFYFNATDLPFGVAGGDLNFLLDFKNIGDWVNLRGDGASNAQWLAGALSNVMFDEISPNFDPDSPKWGNSYVANKIWTEYV